MQLAFRLESVLKGVLTGNLLDKPDNKPDNKLSAHYSKLGPHSATAKQIEYVHEEKMVEYIESAATFEKVD